MTPAERVAKWRAKHARRLARKQRYVPRPFESDELTGLIITDSDWSEIKLR
jgi:hypothetical protein